MRIIKTRKDVKVIGLIGGVPKRAAGDKPHGRRDAAQLTERKHGAGNWTHPVFRDPQLRTLK